MGLKPAAEIMNPFPGLRPFLPEESDMFFGWENESGEITRKLLKNRILTVIGSSGTGKSSLINCGVAAEMIKLTEKDNSALKIISFRPGNDPAGNMLNAFTQTFPGNQINDNGSKLLLSQLDVEHNWIASTVKKMLPGSEEKVLIIIDQFEEFFIYRSNITGNVTDATTAEFVTLLENAVKQTSVEIYILILIRSEYIEECENIRGFTNLINSSNYLLPKMKQANFRSVFENSFLSAGTRTTPNLVVTVLDELSVQVRPLAVLQHLMMRIYSYWRNVGETGRPVDISDYVAVGSMSGAMSKHAEEVYEELSDEGKKICGKMFRAIAGDRIGNKGVRIPLSISSLISVIQCPADELYKVIEKFRTPPGSFLTPGYKVPLDENSVIDISTEALIGLWSRLKSWVDEELSSVRMYRQLSEASEMFQKGKTTLLRDTDLQLAIKWRENHKPTLSWAERYDPAFERVMVYLRTSEKAYLEKKDKTIREHRRKIRRNTITYLILGFVAICSLGLMLFAFERKVASEKQRSEADRQKETAIAKARSAEQNAFNAGKRMAFSDSIAVIASLKEKKARQLIEDYNNQKSLAGQTNSETRKKLSLAIEQSDSARKAAINALEQKNEAKRQRLISLGKSMALKSLQLSGQKDLQTLLAYQAYTFNKSNGGAANDDDIYNGLYNIARQYGNISCKTFTGHTGDIKNIAFVPGKNEFFTSGSDGKVIKWDLEGKNQSLQVVYSGTEIINVLAVSPDERWLACGGQNSGIKMLPVKGNELSFDLKGHTAMIKSLIFSYDGKYLYSASLDGKVLKWDLTSRNATNISDSMMQVTSIDLSADNRYIAGVSNDGKVMVWNPDIANDNFRIESPGKVIRTVKFKPDENILAIGYADGYVDLWDIDARKKISELKAHNSEIISIRFNTKLSQMATAGNDRSIKLWDMKEPSNLPVSFNDNEGLVFTIEFSPDGRVIVSGTSESKNSLMSRPTLADMLGKDLCSTITRNFTVEEWQSYVGKDVEYEKTCPESDFKIKVIGK